MGKKHILLINNINSYGGSTLSFLDIVSMLEDHYTLTLGLPPNSDALMSDFENKGYQCHQFIYFPKFSYYSGGVPLISPTLFKEILNLKYLKLFANEINQVNPDIVILNSMVLSLVGKYINKSIKRVCIVRETPKHTLIDILFKMNFDNNFNAVFFIADYDKRYFNLKKAKSFTLPDVLLAPALEIQHHKEQSNPFNLLFLGGVDPIKGLDILLKAVVLLEDTSIKLLIAGQYSKEDLEIKNISEYINPRYLIFKYRVNKYMKMLTLNNQVQILGFQNNLSRIMNQSNALIFPSTVPHQSRPAIEAGHFKVPVIISDYAATQEYFEHHVNCLTFKPKSSLSLANRIKILKDDKALRQKLIENNYQASIEKHNYSFVQSSILDILDKLTLEGF